MQKSKQETTTTTRQQQQQHTTREPKQTSYITRRTGEFHSMTTNNEIWLKFQNKYALLRVPLPLVIPRFSRNAFFSLFLVLLLRHRRHREKIHAVSLPTFSFSLFSRGFPFYIASLSFRVFLFFCK